MQQLLPARQGGHARDRSPARCAAWSSRSASRRCAASTRRSRSSTASWRCTDPEVFRDRPSEMVRIFNVALDAGAEIYGHTNDLIAERVRRSSADGALGQRRAGAGANSRASSCDERDTRNPSLLEQMHDLGLLAAVMPEFAPCTGRVQHDLYHVFTVDQHQLYAVGRLKALARGELAEELPTATAAIEQVERKRGALPRHAAPRRRQAARQGPLRDGRAPGQAIARAARLERRGRVADRVPGAASTSSCRTCRSGATSTTWP